MREYEHLSHVARDCKYHIVWVPKYRRKQLYGARRRHFGKIMHDLCGQKDIQVVEGHAMLDHVHVCLSFAPKYSISYIVGFLKGKSAIRLNREVVKALRSTPFWIRGYFVSTVGLDEKMIRDYIRHQEHLDKQQMELNLD